MKPIFSIFKVDSTTAMVGMDIKFGTSNLVHLKGHDYEDPQVAIPALGKLTEDNPNTLYVILNTFINIPEKG